MDLDGFLERTASGDGFGRDNSLGRAARAGGKRQPARCSSNQNKLAIAAMAKKLLHRCIGVHARDDDDCFYYYKR